MTGSALAVLLRLTRIWGKPWFGALRGEEIGSARRKEKSREVKERTLRYTFVNLINDPAALRMSSGHGFVRADNSKKI